MHSKKCTRSNLFIQLATRKTFKTQNWLHLNVSTTKDCEKIFLLNIRCLFLFTSWHVWNWNLPGEIFPTFLKADNWSSVFFNAHNYLESHILSSALCFELQPGTSRSYFTGRKMNFSLRHSSAVYSFNKQNITFFHFQFTLSFIHFTLFCVHIWWQRKEENIKIWQRNTAYESCFFLLKG